MASLTFRSALWLFVWLMLWSISLQQSFSFVNPPPEDSGISNPVYTVGDNITIEWVGPNDNISIILVRRMTHDIFNGDYFYVFSNMTDLNGTYTWPIALGGMNLTNSTIFNFYLFTTDIHSAEAVTHDFDLILNSTTNSSSSTATSTSAETSIFSTFTSSSSIISTPTPTPTPTNSLNNSSVPSATDTVDPSSSGLSSGAKAGIGIGVAVGAMALICAAVFLWRQQQGTRGATGAGQPQDGTYLSVNQQPTTEDNKQLASSTEPSDALTGHVMSELFGSVPEPVEIGGASRA